MIEFIYPQIFILMLIPLLILSVILVTRKGKVLKGFSDEVLEKLESAKGGVHRKTRIILLFLAMFLMALALSRPVVNHGEKEIVNKGAHFVAIVDISKSMKSKDVYPNRLEFAKEKLKKFIALSKTDKIAVIGFAGGSFLVSPLTDDKETLIYLVDSLDSDRISLSGSDLLGAIESAEEMLKTKRKAVIIFSDGGESDFSEEIEFVKEKGLKVFAVGVGTQKGAPIPEKSGGFVKHEGNIVVTSLNEKLKDLATKSGGGYIEGSFGEEDMKKLYSAIVSVLEKKEDKRKKIEDFTELFYYPLGLALFLLLFAFHSLPKKNLGAGLALCVLTLTPENSYALSFDFSAMKEADKSYKDGKFQEAIESYKKIGDPSTAQRGKIDYNIGNAKFKMDDYQGAIESYERSLKSNPNDEDAKHNLEVAKKRLEQQKKEQEQQNQENQENKKDKEKQQQNQKNDQKNQEKSEQEKSEEQQKKEQEQQEKGEEKENQQSKSQEDMKEKEEKNQESQMKSIDKEQMEKDLKKEHWLRKLKNVKNPIPLKELNKEKKESTDVKPW